MPTMPKRNYFDRNGSRWVVQGELLIKAGAKVTFEQGAEISSEFVEAVAGVVVEKLPQAELQPCNVAADPGECKATTVAACVAWCNQLRQSLLDAGILGEVASTLEEPPAAPEETPPTSEEPPAALSEA